MKKIKCPYCGKITAVPIVYGYPGCELFEQQEKGETWLGGCEIGEDNPTKYCISCKQSFDKIAFCSLILSKCNFFIGGYTGISFTISIESIDNGYKFTCKKSVHGYEKFEKINEYFIVFSDWDIVWKSILACYVFDWNDEYINTDVIDGTYWELFIELISVVGSKNRIQTKRITGGNLFPVYFNDLLKIYSSLVGEKIG